MSAPRDRFLDGIFLTFISIDIYELSVALGMSFSLIFLDLCIILTQYNVYS